MKNSNKITIELMTAATDEVRPLIGELEAILSAGYTPEQRHGLPLDKIFQPHIRFFVARFDGEAVGCGGVALFDDFAEVKRMYVREAARGRGVADALMEQLEKEAGAAGLHALRLETGDVLVAATKFYTRAGFSMCDAYGEYAAMEPHRIVRSIFMEKRLLEKAA